MAFKRKDITPAVSLPRAELRNLQTLKPYQHNARTHSKRQIEQIARSIERFGFLNPVLIDASGTIIAGHGRVEAAKLLGLAQIPTLRIEHLTDAEKRAYILADNKLAEKAGWDREILAIELQALVDMDFEIELTGFEMAEVDFLLDEATEIKQSPLLPEDSIPELSAEPPVTKLGDLWLLGAHRLYCGDARDERAYETLMKGTKADFVFSDPPYNVPIATDGGTSATSTSDPTAAVTDITLGFTSGASIDNIAPREGDTLFAVNGSLNDADAFVTSYQWQQNLDRPPRGDELDPHRRAGK